jgi:hypothetical protein
VTPYARRLTMLHFPSTANGYPKRSDSLNATQSKSHSNPLLLKIEEEVHDARRVQSHGQEEDLRAALNMVINHVAELVSKVLKLSFQSKINDYV